jgi:hypothetical protein
MKKVLYVPLDDRPVNLDDVIMQGKSAGILVITPHIKDIKNRLDTAMTAEGTRVTSTYQPSFGDPQQLRVFIEQNGHKVDGFIISVDMLVYGGLIGSRRLRSSGGEAYPNYDYSSTYLLEVLTQIKEQYPHKPLYVMDTIMRLATTVQVEGLTMDAYTESRSLMQQPRPAEQDFESILRDYDKKQDGDYFEESIHFNKEQYYNARRHKFKTNRYVLEQLARQGVIDFLAIGVDDAYVSGVQANEIHWMEGKINEWLEGNQGQNSDKAIILPDADGLGHALLARMATFLYDVDSKLKYNVTYFGPHGSTIINPYEYMSVHQNIVHHVDIIGGTLESESDLESKHQYDVHVIAITDPEESPAAVEVMEANASNQIPTVVVDFTGGGAANETVTKALLDSPATGQLFGYSGWNTAGNKLGIALGMAQARYIFLKNEEAIPLLNSSLAAHGSLLLKRFLKDYYYKKLVIAVIRHESNQRAKYTNVTGHQNLILFHTPNEYVLFTSMLREEMQQSTAQLALQPAFSSAQFHEAKQVWKIDEHTWQYAPYGDVTLDESNPAFTWGRAFEITLQPQVVFKNA